MALQFNQAGVQSMFPAPMNTPGVLPPQTPQNPQQAQSAAPDFLRDFLMHILGPALQAQNQNAQGRLQFQNDQTFGRHLGMDGQPIQQAPQTPLTFDQLSVPLADRIAKERATFGGQSFTGGDRAQASPQAMTATQPPSQMFGTPPPMPRQSTPTPSYGSPVYRQQNPQYNMFAGGMQTDPRDGRQYQNGQPYNSPGVGPVRRMF